MCIQKLLVFLSSISRGVLFLGLFGMILSPSIFYESLSNSVFILQLNVTAEKAAGPSVKTTIALFSFSFAPNTN